MLLLIFYDYLLHNYIYVCTKLQLNLVIPHLIFCLKYTLRFTLLFLMILKLNFKSIYRSLGYGGVTGTSWLPVCSRTPTTSASRSSMEKALTTGPCRSSTSRSGTTARTNVRYVKNYCLLLFYGGSGSSANSYYVPVYLSFSSSNIRRLIFDKILFQRKVYVTFKLSLNF